MYFACWLNKLQTRYSNRSCCLTKIVKFKYKVVGYDTNMVDPHPAQLILYILTTMSDNFISIQSCWLLRWYCIVLDKCKCRFNAEILWIYPSLQYAYLLNCILRNKWDNKDEIYSYMWKLRLINLLCSWLLMSCSYYDVNLVISMTCSFLLGLTAIELIKVIGERLAE